MTEWTKHIHAAASSSGTPNIGSSSDILKYQLSFMGDQERQVKTVLAG